MILVTDTVTDGKILSTISRAITLKECVIVLKCHTHIGCRSISHYISPKPCHIIQCPSLYCYWIVECCYKVFLSYNSNKHCINGIRNNIDIRVQYWRYTRVVKLKRKRKIKVKVLTDMLNFHQQKFQFLNVQLAKILFLQDPLCINHNCVNNFHYFD